MNWRIALAIVILIGLGAGIYFFVGRNCAVVGTVVKLAGC